MSAAVVADGVRQPRAARGRARVLRRHPRRPADPARAARGPRRALPRARDRGRLAAERDHRGDARGARARARRPRLHRHEALDAADRARRPRPRSPAAPTGSSASCSRRTTRALSIGEYRAQLEEALAGRAELLFVESWGDEPGFVELLADRVRGTRPPRRLHGALAPGAHPRRGRPVPGAAARDVARSSPSGPASTTGRSRTRASRRPASRGSAPTSSTTSRRCTRAASSDVLVCPVGFVADHLEIRWDLDTEAAERARELGLDLTRIEMPNADPAFVRVLAGLVRRALGVRSAA